MRRCGRKACDKQTMGLLQRRHIRIDQIKYISKESNSLEEIESGWNYSAQDIYREYSDARRDERSIKIIPALKEVPLGASWKLSGLSR